MKVVVIDANWSCPECGRWISPRTLALVPGYKNTWEAHCERDGRIIEPYPTPYRARIEEDA